MPAPRPPAAAPALQPLRPRWARAVPVVAVLAAHALFLTAGRDTPPRHAATLAPQPQAGAPRGVPARRVLVVAPRLNTVPPARPAAAVAVAAPAPARRPAATARPSTRPAPAVPSPPARPADAVPGPIQEPGPERGPDAHVAAAPAPPVYATRLPPPLRLRYALAQGGAPRQAVLDWQVDADGYRLQWHDPDAGAAPLGGLSQGALDGAGIAPLRYAELRRGRERRAVNFQRDAGRITYSGPAVEQPLHRGAQDRLSWMLQLAGVLAADPARAVPGAEVAMVVAGTRGDADTWVFTVQGPSLPTSDDGQPGATVHLRRAPQRPYDLRVDVWLDPARHHLPVRAVLAVQGGGPVLELRLLQLEPGAAP